MSGLEKWLETRKPSAFCIKLDSKDEINGFNALLRTRSSFVCLPDNEYIVLRYALNALAKRGIGFNVKKEEYNT